MRIGSIFLSALLGFYAPLAGAEVLPDWPEFRGPTGQGIAMNATPPLEWSREKNISWRQALPGTGWSSPSVHDDSVYLTAALLDGRDHPESLRVLRIDGGTGAVLWNVEAIPGSPDAQKHPKNGYASPTPLIAEGRIYAHFGPLGTACLDADGQVLWRQTDLAYQTPHGNGGSPVLQDGVLIFSCDDENSPFVVGLDQNTGKVRWKTPRDTQASKKFSFSTPLRIEQDGTPLVVSAGSGMVGAYAPGDGTEIWRVRYGEGFSVVPRPVAADGLVYVTNGFVRPCNIFAIRTAGRGDITDSNVAWTSDSGTPHTPSMVIVDGVLYSVSDRGELSSMDASTGAQHWQISLDGKFSASLSYADGRLYAINEDGTTFVVEASPAHKILAQNEMGERIFASPAFCGSAMFIRTEAALYRIQAVK